MSGGRIREVPTQLVKLLEASVPVDSHWWAAAGDDPDGPPPNWADEIVSGFTLFVAESSDVKLASLAMVSRQMEGDEEPRICYLLLTSRLVVLGVVEVDKSGRKAGVVRALPYSVVVAISVSGALGHYRTSREREGEVLNLSLTLQDQVRTVVSVGAMDSIARHTVEQATTWLGERVGPA